MLCMIWDGYIGVGVKVQGKIIDTMIVAPLD